MVRVVLALGLLAACHFSVQQAPDDGSVAHDVATDATDAIDATDASMDASIDAAAATGLTVSPALKDFGTVPLGSTSSFFSFTVTNIGNASTGALTMMFDSGAAGDYMLASNLCAGAIVPPQGTCTFSIGFKPTQSGTRTASIKITDPATGAQAGVAVTGVALAGTGAIVFNPSTFDFGTVNVGDTAFAHQFTLTNTGGVTTGTIATATGGTNVGEFIKMADGCNGQTLGPGAACTLFISFEPGAAGARSATLNAVATPGGSFTATLSGTGH
jgi:hypothetical protein